MQVVDAQGAQAPRRLSEKYTANGGFHYELIKRKGMVAVYAQKYTEDSEPIAYEVIKIRVAGNRLFKGKITPPYEKAPSTSQWGKYGWSYRLLENATKKFDELVIKEKQAKERTVVIPKGVAA